MLKLLIFINSFSLLKLKYRYIRGVRIKRRFVWQNKYCVRLSWSWFVKNTMENWKSFVKNEMRHNVRICANQPHASLTQFLFRHSNLRSLRMPLMYLYLYISLYHSILFMLFYLFLFFRSEVWHVISMSCLVALSKAIWYFEMVMWHHVIWHSRNTNASERNCMPRLRSSSH